MSVFRKGVAWVSSVGLGFLAAVLTLPPRVADNVPPPPAPLSSPAPDSPSPVTVTLRVSKIQIQNAAGVVNLTMHGDPVPTLEITDARGKVRKLDLSSLAAKLPLFLDLPQDANEKGDASGP